MNTSSQQTEISQKMIEYSDIGLVVIPCEGKKPCLPNWQHRSVPTIEEIEQWEQRFPNSNIGLVLGSRVGIIRIDVDGTEAKQYLAEISNGDLPNTWTYQSSQNGWAYLYRVKRDIQLKKYSKSFSGEHSELAILADGQQTILPPSLHPSGSKYEWLPGKGPDDIQLADAPTWAIDLLTGKKLPEASPLKENIYSDEAEARPVLKKLAKRCALFQQAWNKQHKEGISEEEWHKWVRLIINAEHPSAAYLFSRTSFKHDSRSEQRITDLIEQVDGKGPMVRCTTLGCNNSQIESCLSKLNQNEEGEVTNSPGSIIRDITAILPPTDPIYHPYVQALRDISDYDIDEYGQLCSYDKKGNPVPLANLVARPIREVIRDDGMSEDRAFRIEGVLSGSRLLPPVDIPATDFLAMNWMVHAWGIGASIRPGMGKKELFRDALQRMGEQLMEHRIFTHLGWRQLSDGKWIYLHADGCIGSEDASIEVDRLLARYTLPVHVPDSKKATEASLALLLLAQREITVPLLALVYLAPLVEAFKLAQLEPNFVVWLYGGTGTRKTSLSLVFLSHFGNFISKSPPASFKDTANALERRAFSTKDTLLLIDDYHPESSRQEAQKMEQTAQKILRMYGDRIGRGRLKSTIEFQKEYPPRGMALVTGEDTPKGQSSVARFLGVEILNGNVNLEKLTLAQNQGHLLSQAMVGYINWLRPQMDTLPTRLAKQFHDLREIFQSNAIHGRIGESAAWLHIGYSMMLSYMEYAGILSSEQSRILREEAQNILTLLVHKQGRMVRREQPSDLFANVLSELLTTKKVRVDALKIGQRSDDLFNIEGEKIGWYDDTFYYLLPEATYNCIFKFLKTRGEVIPVTAKTLWKQLQEANIIRVEMNENRVQRCPKKHIPGEQRRPRLLHVYRQAIDQIDHEE